MGSYGEYPLSLSIPKNNKPSHTEEAHGIVPQEVMRSLRRRGYLPLEYPLRALLDSVNWYQQRGLHNGRLPQNCIDQVQYQEGQQMQFLAGDKVYNTNTS